MKLQGNAAHKLRTIDKLELQMRAKHATVEAMHEVTGVAKTTIMLARKGAKIHEKLANLIIAALDNFQFSYKQKPKTSFNLPIGKFEDSTKVKPSLLKNIPLHDNPDEIHSIRLPHQRGVATTMLPLSRTEEEVERLHAYNALVGRR